MKIVKKVEYILKMPLRKKGLIGDVVKVTRGFGRYLESQGVAIRMNAEIMKSIEENKKNWGAKEAQNEKNALVMLEKIKNISMVMKRRVAQGDKLYESVRSEHIVDAFKQHGIEISKDNVKLHNQIKKTGMHAVLIHVYGNHEIMCNIEVMTDALVD